MLKLMFIVGLLILVKLVSAPEAVHTTTINISYDAIEMRIRQKVGLNNTCIVFPAFNATHETKMKIEKFVKLKYVK